MVQQTCREGTWPTSGPIKSSASKALSAAQLDERLASLEQRLEPRLQAMEGLLALIAEVLLKPQGSKDQDHAG